MNNITGNFINVTKYFEIYKKAKKSATKNNKNLINKDYDAIISIGCIIKGETKHFDFISSAVVNGMKDLNIISSIPIILCVSTDDTIQQSIDRSGGKLGNKGADSADAALKMILLNSK